MTRDRSEPRPTVRERIRYRFDNILAKGTWAVLAWLGLVTLIVVLLASFSLRRVGVTLGGSTNSGWFEDFWQSLLRTLDTGTMAGDTGLRPRLVALIVTLFGLLVAGTVIGVIASGVEAQIDRMKRGRSTVIETNHVVVLGGSSILPVVVQQLVLASAQHPTAIVVLADQDSTEMSEEVRQTVQSTGGCRLVFRSGDPTRRDDLELVRPGEARSILVLNGDGENSGDARAVHTVLAVRDLLGEDHLTPVIVMIDDPRTAQALNDSSAQSVHPLVASQAIGRNAAFALRQHGLGEVMAQLTDFRGSDVYVVDEPDAVGSTFGQVVSRCSGARPMGCFRGDGRIELNPDPELVVEHGDRLVVVSDHAGSLSLREPDTELPARVGEALRFDAEPVAEHLVVIGWNAVGPELLTGWAMTAHPDSTLEVVFDDRLLDDADIDLSDLPVASVSVVPTDGGTLSMSTSTTAEAATIVLLAYRDHLPFDECDSRTLLDLVTLKRNLAGNAVTPRLVVELLDEGNVPLAQTWGADETIVTPAMAGRLLAQLGDEPDRRPVYLALYSADGPSLRVVPFAAMGLRGEVSMRDVVGAAHAGGVSAIGWRRDGVTRLNPADADRISLTEGDEIVVVG